MEESSAFVEFLEFLGQKIELHDFKGSGQTLDFFLFSQQKIQALPSVAPNVRPSFTLLSFGIQ